jgi:hypothetical protein
MSGGIVGVIANDFARSSLFTSCVWKLDVPDGWSKEMLIGGDWCSARNTFCKMVLESDASHLWFMDDDHAFPAGMLKKLLAHDKPFVMPICLARIYPFTPVQYTKKIGHNVYLPIPLSEADTEGLIEVEAGGCAGMLIRRDVIEAIEPPWFEYTDRSEDIIFSEKAKAAGFTLYADLGCRLGHITTAVVHPGVKDGKWKTGLTIGRDMNLIVDTAEEFAANKDDVAPDNHWLWTLRRMLTGEDIVMVFVPPWEQIAWDPGDDAPEGVLQWWVDEQDGSEEHTVGDPFSYYPVEA